MSGMPASAGSTAAPPSRALTNQSYFTPAGASAASAKITWNGSPTLGTAGSSLKGLVWAAAVPSATNDQRLTITTERSDMHVTPCGGRQVGSLRPNYSPQNSGIAGRINYPLDAFYQD